MAREIERRFLVVGEPWHGHPGQAIEQAYVAIEDRRSVRVRLRGGVGTLTIKGPQVGMTRVEVEVPIGAEDARLLLDEVSGSGRIDKVRYLVPFEGRVWEVDVFRGDNAGLVVAEIELDDEGDAVDVPPWCGVEVTHDGRLSNASLSGRPWSAWSEAERRTAGTPS